MEFILIPLVAGATSLLTLFSGFGLGTLLMPVMALFFPLELAIALTAMVHLANNLFKLSLLGKQANWQVVAKFGVPALIFAFVGAFCLTQLSQTFDRQLSYQLLDYQGNTSWLKLILGSVILLFVWLELSSVLKKYSLPTKYLPIGGMISGFFGGLSGHQGAMRSMFLLKANLSKQAYVATGVVIAVLVDVARLTFYSQSFSLEIIKQQQSLLVVSCLSAFLGAYFGKKWLTKITLNWLHNLVSILLAVIAISLMLGVI